jgi:hypothetical protein
VAKSFKGGGPALSKAEREERERLAAAIQRLANRLGWPADIAELGRQALQLEVHVDRSWIFTKKYSLPDFLINEQSPEEWTREADEKYHKFRDDELRKCLSANNVDFPVVEPTKRRGRRNASINARHEWAALRWLRYDWDTIARLYFTCDLEQELAAAIARVTKAGNEILRRAGLLEKSDRK